MPVFHYLSPRNPDNTKRLSQVVRATRIRIHTCMREKTFWRVINHVNIALLCDILNIIILHSVVSDFRVRFIILMIADLEKSTE